MSIRAAITLSTAVLLLGLLYFLRSSPRPSAHTIAGGRSSQATKIGLTPQRSRAGGSTPARAPRLSPAPTRVSRKEIEHQDTYLQSRQGRQRLHEEHTRQPAYQHLPYRTDEVRIEIVNVTSDGRVVLKVIPLGLNANPRTAYKHFLRRYHDPGNSYLPEYGRYQP
jgi:hypothetical protein